MSRRNYWTTLRQRKISRRTMLGASAKAGIGAAGLALVGCGDDDDDAAPAAVDSSAIDAAAGDAAAAAEAASAAADAAGRAAEAAEAASAMAAEAAESDDAEQAAAAAQAAADAAADAADAAADAADAARAAGDAGAAAVAQAAADAAEAAAAAAREAGAEDTAAAAAAAQAAADAAAAAAAAAGEASAAAAETAAAAVAAAEEAADAAREAADAAAMADEEDAPAVAAAGGVYRRPNTSTPNFVRLGLGDAGNINGYGSDFSIFERLARVSGTTWEADPSGGVSMERVSDLDFTVEPVLATGWERPDDTTWVFGIRTDPVWHTGRPFDIDDVHFMFEAIRDENVAGGGTPAFRLSKNLDVREPVDASTYRLTLTRPTGYIETLLEGTNLVDRETYDQRIDDAVVVGTGPYTFENYDPNRGWDQLPHADFQSQNNHPVYSGGAPQFDKIEHTIFADTAAMALALEAGELDSHQGIAIGIPEVEERLLENEDFRGRTGHGQGCRVVRFRADSEPFNNKLARQAVLMLVDGDRVTQDFAGAFDQPGRLPWQPGSAGRIPDLDPHLMGVDPEAARAEAGRLFEAAGFTGGEVLKMDMLPERLDAPATAQLIQQEVAAFGIETEISPREYTEMITLQSTGTFDHMMIGFGNWLKPGSTAVTVLFSDAYDGAQNAPADENVAIADRPGIRDEPEWLDMVQQAIDGTWTDWQAWNEKYLDVAWSNVVFRSYGVDFWKKNVEHSSIDSNGWPYAPGTRFVT